MDKYFAMCLVTKNENESLGKWIEYHKRMGCSQFYIFDHNSTIPLLNDIEEYVASGLVEYFYFTDFVNSHIPVELIDFMYDRCFNPFGNNYNIHKFIGFLDIDEFIVVKNNSLKIPDILSDYEEYSNVALNLMSSVLGNDNKYYRTDLVKHIVNPSHITHMDGSSHYFTQPVLNTTIKDENYHVGFETMYIKHTKNIKDVALEIIYEEPV